MNLIEIDTSSRNETVLQNKQDKCVTRNMSEQLLSNLSRSLLVLVVLAGLSKSLGLQALDQILVLPTELGRKVTQSDEVTVRSKQ